MFVNMSVYLLDCLYVCILMSLGMSLYLSICQSSCLSLFQSFSLSVSLSLFMSIRLSISFCLCMSLCLSPYAHACLFVCLSVSQRHYAGVKKLRHYWTTLMSRYVAMEILDIPGRCCLQHSWTFRTFSAMW